MPTGAAGRGRRGNRTPGTAGLRARRWVFRVVSPGGRRRAERIFDRVLVVLILANIVSIVLETVEPLVAVALPVFVTIEVACVTVFSIEYALRLWTAVEHPAYRRPVSGRIRFALRPMMLLDAVATLPTLLILIAVAVGLPVSAVNLGMLRALRLLRVLRVFRLQKYSRAVRTVASVCASRREELVVALSVMLLLLLLAGTGMYMAEREAQPEAFGSIPDAMWWAVATLSTVGYGDVTPVTPLGKMFASVVAIVGIAMFAIPSGILGGAFVEHMQRARARAEQAERRGQIGDPGSPAE